MASSSSNEAKAELAQREAEEKFRANDLAGARSLAHEASKLCSSLPGLRHMVAAVDVLFAASTSELQPAGGTDYWFAVLGIHPAADLGSAKKRFRTLCILTHPDKNPSAAAGPAFKLVMKAWSSVSSSYRSASSSSSSSSSFWSTRKPAASCAARPSAEPKKGGPAADDEGEPRSRTWSWSGACPHCEDEFSCDIKMACNREGVAVRCRMECPSCGGWVAVQPLSSPTARPLKRRTM